MGAKERNIWIGVAVLMMIVFGIVLPIVNNRYQVRLYGSAVVEGESGWVTRDAAIRLQLGGNLIVYPNEELGGKPKKGELVRMSINGVTLVAAIWSYDQEVGHADIIRVSMKLPAESFANSRFAGNIAGRPLSEILSDIEIKKK